MLGSLGVAGALGLYALTGDELFKALAFVGFFLNLFNLLPVLPLDGGRAMAALLALDVARGLRATRRCHFASPTRSCCSCLFGGLETLPLAGAQGP